MFSLFFLLRRFWYGFWYLSIASFSFPFFHKSLWMNLTTDCRVFENVTKSKGNLFIINTFTEKCVFADYFYPFLSTLLSFLFLFLFLSIYLLRFWYLSQSERPLNLHILFASCLPLHDKREFMAHFTKDLIRKVFIKQPNSHERARAEEIEAKFFFFTSLLCPIFFLFLFPMNFWISFTAFGMTSQRQSSARRHTEKTFTSF